MIKINFEWVQKNNNWYLQDPLGNSIASIEYYASRQACKWRICLGSGVSKSGWCDGSVEFGKRCVEDILKGV